MIHIIKSHMLLKVTISLLLLLCFPFFCSSQIKIKTLKDSVVFKSFFGKTNDEIYWNNEIFNCSHSPLSSFKGYDSLYIPPNIICYNSYEGFIDDKEYTASWVIVDNYLYLCDVRSVCSRFVISPCLEDYLEAFDRGISLDNHFLIKFFPLEKLIGQKFQKILPAGIYQAPLSSGYAIAANWFSGAIEVQNYKSDIFSSYQRLVFKDGKMIATQNLKYKR